MIRPTEAAYLAMVDAAALTARELADAAPGPWRDYIAQLLERQIADAERQLATLGAA